MKTVNLKTLSNKIKAYQSALKYEKYTLAADINSEIADILEDLPHGSGIDSGMQLKLEESKPDKIIFEFAYHHLNENGYYTTWTKHLLILKPSFIFSIDMRITGRNLNEVKDYLYDLFHSTFSN